MGKQAKLAALRGSNDPLEFWKNDNPKCPHCAHDFNIEENEAWHLYSPDGGRVTCNECGLPFSVETNVSYTFSTEEQDDDA